MESRIVLLPAKKLVGRRMKMSFLNDRTVLLWQSFMPERKKIKNKLGPDLINMKIFDDNYRAGDFSSDATFENWAAIEVADFDSVPEGMDTHTIRGGLYAVFVHYGPESTFPKTLAYIFNEWMPASPYVADSREYFEILGAKYKHGAPDSEEEVWIPVREK